MLRYVDDASTPGITRKRRGRYWMYFHADGSRVSDRDEIDRLNAVGMPPAYERCWFCPYPNGHMQAVGYDAKGRKQYRYHPDFRAQQESAKYERLAAFGRALPKLTFPRMGGSGLSTGSGWPRTRVRAGGAAMATWGVSDRVVFPAISNNAGRAAIVNPNPRAFLTNSRRV